jgi:hypothetical protein
MLANTLAYCATRVKNKGVRIFAAGAKGRAPFYATLGLTKNGNERLFVQADPKNKLSQNVFFSFKNF